MTSTEISYAAWPSTYLALIELNRTDRTEMWALTLAESDAAKAGATPCPSSSG